MSVTDLKAKLSGMTHKAPETIRLIYKAKNLEDSKKISDYSKQARLSPYILVVEQDQVIHMVNQP